MSDFSFAIIGTGGMAEKHASAILKQNSASLIAVRSRKIERAIEFSSRHGSIMPYEEVEYLLDNRDVDGVIVTAALEERAECIRLALQSGRPVIAASPIARDSAEAYSLIELSEREGASLIPFVSMRYAEGIRFLRNAIEKGQFGKILRITVSYHFDKSESAFAADSDSSPLILKEGFEALDVLLFLLGAPELISSFSGNIAARSDAEDIFSVSFIGNEAVHGELSLISSAFAHDSFHVSIVGSDGYGEYENGKLECFFRFGGKIELHDSASTISLFYRDCLDSIFSGTEALSKAREGLLAIRVAEAILTASRRIDL